MTKRWTYSPASDLMLPPEERWRSVRREQGLFSWLGHRASLGVLRAYFGVCHRLRVIGAEHLPLAPPFVVISNHASHLDSLALACVLPRTARSFAFPIAAGDAFFNSVLLSALSATFINAVPLWRKKVTTHAMADLRTRLLEGRSGFILFPEGSRTRDGGVQAFRAGLGMLVAGTGVPVVPCYIDGAFSAMPPGSRVPRPRRLTIIVGPALRFDDVPDEREGWTRIAEQTRARVMALAGACGADRPEPARPG
ncbi:MAG: lysophospholipid acyltransferase family protein [Planctomycetota bacterium]|nr:lysophospholipid acyltransferase family protein [Planctomycetota bacterium]